MKHKRPIQSYKRCRRTSEWTGLPSHTNPVSRKGLGFGEQDCSRHIITHYQVIFKRFCNKAQWQFLQINRNIHRPLWLIGSKGLLSAPWEPEKGLNYITSTFAMQKYLECTVSKRRSSY